ncbi:MAG: TrkH family potassium uptake protein [Candidatus Binatia bacterium]
MDRGILTHWWGRPGNRRQTPAGNSSTASRPRGRRSVPPPALLALALLTSILVGSVLLELPFAQRNATLTWLDTLFTATSATCVTGLVVVDTGSQFTGIGQLIILLLIQIGGLGVMTTGTLVLIALGQHPTGAVQHLLTGYASHRPTLRARDILGTVVLTTFVVESIGAVLLYLAFAPTHPLPEALWLAIFHSVSAFCNAGFALWPDSLTRYATDPLVNVTIGGLTLIGGLGFVVIVELRHWLASGLARRKHHVRLSVHTKIVLAATVIAFTVGTGLFLLLEARNVLVGRTWSDALWIASFHAVAVRTAGFNTVDIQSLSNPTLLLMLALMFIGAGPGSMAGGIKLTTATVVAALVAYRIRGNKEVCIFARAVGESTIQRAVVLTVLAVILVASTVAVMEVARNSGPPNTADRAEVLAVVFEAVSAFGTVGLSMGITAELGTIEKLVIILLMFVGRLGPLALMDFFAHLPPSPPIRHAKEELMVG